jgi:hypothetical protein
MIPSRLLLPVLLCVATAAKAQVIDTAAAEITPRVDNNRVQFGSVLRPLRQVAGAPASFYTYFWEFGDGSYSFEKEPVHVYRDTGLYNVRLYATNNYDDGKKPPTRPRPVRVNNRSLAVNNTKPAFFTGNGSLEIKSNQMPKPGEEMVLLIGYRNNQGGSMNGSIMLLYNEKQFSQNSFDVADVRHYHRETTIGFESMLAWAPADAMEVKEASGAGWFTAGGIQYTPPADRQLMMQQVKQEMSGFRKHDIWKVKEVQQGEERFMFLSVNTLPEMIKDTNAVVTITGLFIPDDPTMDMEKFNLELQIVASHDPNRIMLKKKRLNYRFTNKNRNNTYKVQFQNTGKGPAKRVAITVMMPGMLNASSIELVDMKPLCAWCKLAYNNQSCIDTVITKDSVQFIFKNIYLPGTQQDGVNNPDSTQGYIRYRIRFDKGLKKVPFTTRAAIVFDKNEPVYTNRSVGRFKKGLSPGIVIGYNTVTGKIPADLSPQQYSIGVTVSEFAAYRSYFQWELFLQSARSYQTLLNRQTGRDTVINNVGYKMNYRDVYQKLQSTTIEAVPLEFRYNMSSYAAVGIGTLVSCEVSRQTTANVRAEIVNPNGVTTLLEGEVANRSESFAAWRGALFGDLLLGKVRVGPAVGVRYMQYFNPSFQRILFYVTWKF